MGFPFRLLLDAHASFVDRRARDAGVPSRDVPDVRQKVFLALHEALARGLDPSRSLRGWLAVVTFRTARDHLKLAFNEREALSPTGIIETAGRSPTPEEHVQAIDVHRVMESVLDVLPPEQRIVFAMSDIEEMPMSEIAGVLEIPVGTGYTRLRAARRTFEAEWNKRRTSGQAAVLPFMLWDAGDLLHAAQPTPELPPELVDEAWRRLLTALGTGIAGASAATAASGAVAAGATKAGVVLTAKQLALGAVMAALAGAGIYAAARSVLDAPAPQAIASAISDTDKTERGAAAASLSAAPSASFALAPQVEPSATATASASSVVGPSRGTEANERLLLDTARAAIERGDLSTARGALARVKSPRFAAERDELRRIVLAHQDGGTR